MSELAALTATRLGATVAHRTWNVAGAERCHLLLLRAGRATLTRAAAAEPDEIAAPALLWLPPGTQASLRVLAGGDGFLASLAAGFVQRTIAESAATAPLRPLLDQVVLAGPDPVAARLATLTASFEALVEESQALLPGAPAVIGLHLGLLLLHAWRCAGLYRTAALRGLGASTAQRFRHLVELHYRDGMRIDDFAARLGVSRAHLHGSCLRATGRTPLALLHERLLAEARSRLEQTDLSVEQVGYGIGFRDPGYFNRFFKRLSGQSPGAYRRASLAGRPAQVASTAFAAWP